jgi:hypothetical protein
VQGCSDIFYCQQKVSQQPAGGTAGYNGLVNVTDPNGNGDHYLFHGKVMAWSAGPDGKVDSTSKASFRGTPNSDNVLSWQ